MLDSFIEAAKELFGDSLPDDVRRQWLHFQIRSPVKVYDKDPFTACINKYLIGEDPANVEFELNEVGPMGTMGPHFDPEADTFFIVLDEGQAAANRYMGAFSDEGGKDPRPVLRPIIRTIHKFHPAEHFQYIVSGTSFSLKLFEKVLTSGVAKKVKWQTGRRVGDFTDKEVQRNYISRYLLHFALSIIEGSRGRVARVEVKTPPGNVANACLSSFSTCLTAALLESKLTLSGNAATSRNMLYRPVVNGLSGLLMAASIAPTWPPFRTPFFTVSGSPF